HYHPLLSLSRRPPPPPLFPYTTLFRSRRLAPVDRLRPDRRAGRAGRVQGAGRAGGRVMEPGLLKSADWPALIDVYFFLGGMAGGAFVIATVANLLDRERYRDIVRIGYYVAFLAVIPG